LQLEFVSDNLKVRAIKLERPVIECPVLEVRKAKNGNFDFNIGTGE
jgi:hypothetical protein